VNFESYELLTFDCYGTLIDWESGILDAVRPVLERHDVNPSDEEVLELYARTEAKHEQDDYVRYEVLLRFVMAEMSLRLGVDLAPDEVGVIEKSLPSWPPFPDSVRALRRLKKRFKLGIISNVDDAMFAHTARSLEVHFDYVVTAQQAGAYKPSHRIFQMAFERFGIPRERILHVAQSIYHDVVPARELGVASVWVNRRKGRPGHGATPPADAVPDLEVPDLVSLADLAGPGGQE
jgi:2-haloacid dehalogenase